MHRIFQRFIDQLSAGTDALSLRAAMADAAGALDLRCFAYLALPKGRGAEPQLISNYPSAWTTHYLHNQYERLDPVIVRALSDPEPFEWGVGIGPVEMSLSQRELFEEATRFGIRYGFTVPIHDGRGPIAAVTFTADERWPQFERCVNEYARVLSSAKRPTPPC
jgi:LuxR family transcriptional activator of conjugal transfer of Ti plasmids